MYINRVIKYKMKASSSRRTVKQYFEESQESQRASQQYPTIKPIIDTQEFLKFRRDSADSYVDDVQSEDQDEYSQTLTCEEFSQTENETEMIEDMNSSETQLIALYNYRLNLNRFLIIEMYLVYVIILISFYTFVWPNLFTGYGMRY